MFGSKPDSHSLPALWIYFLTLCTGFCAEHDLPRVHGWAYQLQEIDIGEAAGNTTFDLFIMDYSADGTHGGRFSKTDIQSLRASGKAVLAYVSIGEAENYRFYWQSGWDKNGDGVPDSGAPAWLGPENPDWEGNYKVRFWHPGWQRTVLAMVDTLAGQGFDGIYCDIVDAYEYWSYERGEEPAADSLMVRFILRIRSHADSLGRPFHLVPQNAEALPWEPRVDDASREAYFSAIQAIGVEDVFFPGWREEDNFFRPESERIQNLILFRDRGKPVLSVEYLKSKFYRALHVDTCLRLGFYPYATFRSLDRLEDGIDTGVPQNESREPFLNLRLSPNPFNGALCIQVSLPGTDAFTVEIFDLLGRRVRFWRRSASRVTEPILWDCRDESGKPAAGGLYGVRLRSGSGVVTRKALYIR